MPKFIRSRQKLSKKRGHTKFVMVLQHHRLGCWPVYYVGVGVLTRGSGSQLVNAACFLVPDDDARGNTVTHGFYPGSGHGAVRPARGCASALYYLAPKALVVGDTSEAREGGRLPSLC